MKFVVLVGIRKDTFMSAKNAHLTHLEEMLQGIWLQKTQGTYFPTFYSNFQHLLNVFYEYF